MTQSLELYSSGVTQLYNHSKYYHGSDTNIAKWLNMANNFITYMPDSKSYVGATTFLQLHDCYKSGDTGYAHASFAFNTPGYYANFPVAFGFAGVNSAGSVWVIGQKQWVIYNTGVPTHFDAVLEVSFGWPTAACGIVPFIAAGGTQFSQRYWGDSYTGNITYTTEAANSTLASTKYWGNLVSVTGASANADMFASNAYNVTQDHWGATHKICCPYDYSNWNANAGSTFLGGWANRQASYADGWNNCTVGAGFVFCGKPIAEGGSYTAWPTLSNAPFTVTTKVWVYDSNGKPQRAKQVWVYNSSGVPTRAKALYVYNSSGTPVRVF